MDTQTIKFLTENMLYLLATPCIITFLLFGWDKHQAHYHRSRVPEAVLFLLCFLYGAFGGLCGMIFFRHKTRHMSFKIIVPLLAIIQIAAIVYFKVKIAK